MQIFKSAPPLPPPVQHAVGDKVMWKGIGPLTVHRIESEAIYAHSLTLQLVVSSHDQLEKVT
jgi:hypothetical protein